MNREQRRKLKTKLAPTARRIAALENQIKAGGNKEQLEKEIADIMDSMSLIEMMALQDYIESKGLLNNFDHNNK